jgi:hypothetical protein
VKGPRVKAQIAQIAEKIGVDSAAKMALGPGDEI